AAETGEHVPGVRCREYAVQRTGQVLGRLTAELADKEVLDSRVGPGSARERLEQQSQLGARTEHIRCDELCGGEGDAAEPAVAIDVKRQAGWRSDQLIAQTELIDERCEVAGETGTLRSPVEQAAFDTAAPHGAADAAGALEKDEAAAAARQMMSQRESADAAANDADHGTAVRARTASLDGCAVHLRHCGGHARLDLFGRPHSAQVELEVRYGTRTQLRNQLARLARRQAVEIGRAHV